MSIFGEKFGLVFQIKDDLLDITGNIEGLGKPAGFDLKKNMLTLPLIYLFENLERSSAKTLKRKIGKHVKRSELKEVRRLIEENGGIEYAEKQIDRLSKDAISELDIFPDSKYKQALVAALEFNFNRNG
jgi:octaprenyl-diphosphate synthase